MDIFESYLERIEDEQQRARTKEILSWVMKQFPHLAPKIAWNHPMFTDHETYIVGFSVSKNHLAIGFEGPEIIHFCDEIKKAGYTHSKKLVKILWNDHIDYTLIEKMITFNIIEKSQCTTFWRS